MLSDRIYDGAPNVLAKLGLTMEAGGTGAAGGAWSTSGTRNAFIAQVQSISDKVDALIDQLRAYGINV